VSAESTGHRVEPRRPPARAPSAAIEVLPEIREPSAAALPSWSTRRAARRGYRNRALLGADFVFLEGAIYGLAAGGLAGATRAIEILREELDLTMGQIGLNRAGDLRSDVLMEHRSRAAPPNIVPRQPAGARPAFTAPPRERELKRVPSAVDIQFGVQLLDSV